MAHAPRPLSLANGRFPVRAFVPWDGVTALPAGTLAAPMAFDTETHLIDRSVPAHVPRMVLGTACSGGVSVLLWPEQMPAFIAMHRASHLCGHNIAFDFWVVDALLEREGQAEARRQWRAIFDEGRAHDTMILDQLSRLASCPYPVSTSEKLPTRGLDAVCDEWLGKGLVSKEGPYRLRYAEVEADRGLLEQEPGFWQYALADALAVRLLWPKLLARARMLSSRAAKAGCFAWPKGRGPDEAQWGPLTESVQVRGAIALMAAERAGMAVDIAKAKEAEARLEASLAEATEAMDRCFPRALKRMKGRRKDAPGQCFIPGAEPPLAKAGKSGAPGLVHAELQQALALCASLAGEEPILREDGSVSLESKKWVLRAESHPFIKAWTGMASEAKLLALERAIASKKTCHPRYWPLLRTGRVSASSPNLLQAPKVPWFRQQFVSRPGCMLHVVDYSFIELRTFAAVCERTMGHSVLGKTIRAGRDPHCYTAAILDGIEYDDFVARLAEEKAAIKKALALGTAPPPAPYAYKRQGGKSISFGVIGGLGPKKLSIYVKTTYGVDMDQSTASKVRRRVTTEVYPEMGQYLQDSPLASVAYALGVGIRDARSALSGTWPRGRTVEEWLSGEKPSPPGLWKALSGLAAQGRGVPYSAMRDLGKGKGTPALAKWLLSGPSATLTGRIRGSCAYTQRMNNPFQGLAADGAKLAMWRLVHEHYMPVAFVHDEIVVEVPRHGAEAAVSAIERIMTEEMERVLSGVPAAVEGRLGESWAK